MVVEVVRDRGERVWLPAASLFAVSVISSGGGGQGRGGRIDAFFGGGEFSI